MIQTDAIFASTSTTSRFSYWHEDVYVMACQLEQNRLRQAMLPQMVCKYSLMQAFDLLDELGDSSYVRPLVSLQYDHISII